MFLTQKVTNIKSKTKMSSLFAVVSSIVMLNLEKLREKEKDIRFELSKDESYTDQIETYKNKVKKLDKKLGVDKK